MLTKLSELLAEIYDHTNHMFPSRIARRVLRWLLWKDTITVTDDALTTDDIPHPATWATTPFDPTQNIYWNDGVWG